MITASHWATWLLRSFQHIPKIILSVGSDITISCVFTLGFTGIFNLPSIFPSIRVFSNELALCIRWPKYWGFSISPSNEYSQLISFRVNSFDLAVQGTLGSLLQHHSSKASVLQCSDFLRSNSHICTWLLEKPQFWLSGPLSAKQCLWLSICPVGWS